MSNLLLLKLQDALKRLQAKLSRQPALLPQPSPWRSRSPPHPAAPSLPSPSPPSPPPGQSCSLLPPSLSRCALQLPPTPPLPPPRTGRPPHHRSLRSPSPPCPRRRRGSQAPTPSSNTELPRKSSWIWTVILTVAAALIELMLANACSNTTQEERPVNSIQTVFIICL